jgi:polyisoprenyl-teichoic acid--peptidoglycan teichoic acid transferase
MARARTAWRDDDWVAAEDLVPRPRLDRSSDRPSDRSSRRSPQRPPHRPSRRGSTRGSGLGRALGLTFVSSLVWGVAHVSVGRRLAGFSLMALFGVLVAGTGVLAVGIPAGYTKNLMPIAVERVWLDGITVGILVLALVWATVVIRSYQLVRPEGLPTLTRLASGSLVLILVVGVCVPMVYAASATYVLRDTLGDIFPGDDRSGPAVDAANPWKNLPRVNILLLGGDGGRDRAGIRTDSMTVASIDTKTGNTVLISLPRALQHFQLPPRLRSRWPNGYTGDPGDQGLLNELYIIGERHPELAPGYRAGRRGPHLLQEVIGYLIGMKIHYYALVNLAGFKDIVNAIGGVRIHVEKRLPIGGDPARGVPPTGYIEPGLHKLNGENALWYGRSRHADDDFHRMDRQKCLMKAIADQADPQQVLTHVQKLASAAKHTISTNIPAKLLPALVELASSVKKGAQVRSLPFDPARLAGFRVYQPNIALMRAFTAQAIAGGAQTKAAKPSRSASGGAATSRKPTTRSTAATTRAGRGGNGVVSLDRACG